MKNISPEKLEELMKEFDNYETETLEETAEKYANEWEEIYPELDPENMTPIEISKIDFIAGVKLQQKRSYSKEEVKEILQKYLYFLDENSEKMQMNSLSNFLN